jgi:hypothetical protein
VLDDGRLLQSTAPVPEELLRMLQDREELEAGAAPAARSWNVSGASGAAPLPVCSRTIPGCSASTGQ